MAHTHWNKKWKAPREHQEVFLTVDRCVVKVGYDWDMEAAQGEILREAGSHPLAPWEDVMKHPGLGSFKDAADIVLACLSKPLGHTKAIAVVERLKRGAVREFVSRRLRDKMHGGARREIHFGPVEGKDWEGPWRVLGRRRAVTGVYVQGHDWGGYDGEYDYEPPDLKNRKVHVLLLASRAGTFERVVLLESDTCDWANKKIADRLMQEA